MGRRLRERVALTLGIIMVALAAVPARAAENTDLAAEFGGFGRGGVVADAPLAISDIALQPDGRLVAAGTRAGGFAVARLLPDGTLDASFGGGVVVLPISPGQLGAGARAVALGRDGRIVVAGSVVDATGQRFAMARLLPDGTPDVTFDGDGAAVLGFGSNDAAAESVGIDSAGRVIAAGWSGTGADADFAVARLTPGGAPDAGFSEDGRRLVDFGFGERAFALLVQPDDKLVLAGAAALATGAFAVARLLPDGALDAGFAKEGQRITVIGDGAAAHSVALQPDGRLVLAGTGDDGRFALARYRPDGALDPDFDGDGVVTTSLGRRAGANAVALLPDGRLLAAGAAAGQIALARYQPDASLDTSFGDGGRLLLPRATPDPAGASGMALSADLRISLAGGALVTRLLANGTLDSGGRQIARPAPEPEDTIQVALATLAQPDGMVVSAGQIDGPTDGDIALTRHTADGRLDPGFGVGGSVRLVRGGTRETLADALLQPDGKIVVLGTAQSDVKEDKGDLVVARFNPDGSLDRSCGQGGVATLDLIEGERDEAHSVALQADGKIVIASIVAYAKQPVRRTLVARLNPSCALDTSFGKEGRIGLDSGSPLKVLALPDGKLLVVDAEDNAALLTRLEADGSYDETFGKEGRRRVFLAADSTPSAAAALPGGRLLLAGEPFESDANDALLVRVNADGTVDPSFGDGGVARAPFAAAKVHYALAVRDDGAIAIGGCLADDGGAPVALFTPDGRLDRSFAGDGRTDLTIGGATCLRGAAFSDRRLLVGGYTVAGRYASFALAAYTLGEPREVQFAGGVGRRVTEGAQRVLLPVSLTQTSAQTVTVRYAATGGSARPGADYELAAGTLSFAPGQTSRLLAVTILDDREAEPPETVTITLSDPQGAALGGRPAITLTIDDDEAPRETLPWQTFLPVAQR